MPNVWADTPEEKNSGLPAVGMDSNWLLLAGLTVFTKVVRTQYFCCERGLFEGVCE